MLRITMNKYKIQQITLKYNDCIDFFEKKYNITLRKFNYKGVMQ